MRSFFRSSKNGRANCLFARTNRIFRESGETLHLVDDKEEALMDPFFVISQVMNLGDLKDSAKLFCEFDHKILRQVLLNAKAGWFSDKRTWGSWNNLLFPEYNFVTPPMPVMDFSHYFRWLFANFRERFLSS